MIAAFVEAVGDLALPCSLTLVIPTVAATLTSRSNPLAVALSASAGVFVVGWLRITGQIGAFDTAWVAIALAVLTLIAFGALVRTATRPSQRVTAAAVIGGVAASIWTPCVGVELGVILTQGPDDPLGVAMPFAAFITGIGVAAIAAGLGLIAFQPPYRVSRALNVIGALVGTAIAFLLGTGLYADVVATLVTWSL